MRSGFDRAAAQALPAILWAATVGVALILLFIVVRRAVRKRYFARRDERARWAREGWSAIVAGEIAAEQWNGDELAREVIEDIALNRRDVAGFEEAEALNAFFRRSGLLDRRIYAAQHARGADQVESIQVLGRIRAPEARAVVGRLLARGNPETSIEAVRAAARIGDASLGAVLVESLARGLNCPYAVLAPAVLRCFESAPDDLAALVANADGSLRPLLARVLAEVARPGTDCNAVLLAGDPNPEVRASAARILGKALPPEGAAVLTPLAEDPEWFVRMRAMAALGAPRDPFTVPTLIRGLCDPNRLVRVRAAEALASIDGEEIRILLLVRRAGDRYALQSLVCEYERRGKLDAVFAACATGASLAREVFETLADAGVVRTMAHAAQQSPDLGIRTALAAYLRGSRHSAVVEYLAHATLPAQSVETEVANHADDIAALTRSLSGAQLVSDTAEPA